MDGKRELGPNAVKLLARFVGREAVGLGGGLADVQTFVLDAAHRWRVVERALARMDAALDAVRAAPDNAYGDREEDLAAAILSQVESRRATKRREGARAHAER